MTEGKENEELKGRRRLSEDWLAVIIALALVGLVWGGVITRVPWPVFGFLK